MATPRTPAEWWADVKRSPKKFEQWLAKQYHGEMTAAPRIRALASRPDVMPHEARVLNVIASQEEAHAQWIAALLKSRELEPKRLAKNERYWNETLSGAEDSFNYLCAVATHAETMRLERIRVIADDKHAPPDVRATFQKILKDEEFHAKTFAELANKQALSEARGRHEKGMAALGLVI